MTNLMNPAIHNYLVECLITSLCLELSKDVINMKLDCALAALQAAGDIAIMQTLSE